MPSLKQTPLRELIRKFNALGWVGPVYGTKHPFMKKGKRKQHIPNPHRQKAIGPELLKEILRQAEITENEWNDV
jgi:predicted RNA binding protein YcfA (HicA-like mRNA interferase family)